MKRRFVLFGLLSVVALAASLIAVVPAAASSFTVSPWAYACSTTHSGNPASNTDPGPTCDHNGSADGLGTGYCGDPQGSVVDTPGTVMSSYTAGKLTLTKTGAQCDDMAPGATIGGLVTLTAASADCKSDNCNPGGNLRLNVQAGDGFHFVGGTQDANGHITFAIPEGGFTGVTEIDIIADAVPNNESSTVIIDNLSFTGAGPTPKPTSSPTARVTPKPPTTGVGGNQNPPVAWLLALFAVAAFNGGLFLLARRK